MPAKIATPAAAVGSSRLAAASGSGGARGAAGSTRACPGRDIGLHGDERGDRKIGELGAAGQERQLEQNGDPGDLGPRALHQVDRGAAVPPVARTSSIISTRSPGSKASVCTSIVAVPYSSWYSCAYVAPGSLPFFLIGTNPAPSRAATGAARMKPRASIPATLSTGP